MANASILAAFERMWQHITYAIGNKSDVADVDELRALKVSKTETDMTALFASGKTVLSSNQYGDELPEAGTIGRVFFKRVSE